MVFRCGRRQDGESRSTSRRKSSWFDSHLAPFLAPPKAMSLCAPAGAMTALALGSMAAETDLRLDVILRDPNNAAIASSRLRGITESSAYPRMLEKPQFSPPFRWRSMVRPLRVTGAKLKASDFLLRLSEARRRWAKESGLPVSASINPSRKRHDQHSGF